MERKLASIRRVARIFPIDGADAIEAIEIDGWTVVAKKGEHQVGDLVVYFEIDSWVPTELAPFLSKGSVPREYNGVKGERLRTVRLRGQVSQGLILPLVPSPHDTLKEGSYLEIRRNHESPFALNVDAFTVAEYVSLGSAMPANCNILVHEGDDVTEILGIQKWEAPISAQLAGVARGTFPTSLIPKTDQERVQNIFKEVQRRDGLFVTEKVWNAATQVLEDRDVVFPADFVKPTYEVTLKLDGSSMTLFRHEEDLRVCSRNMELVVGDGNVGNSFVKKALEIGDLIPEGYAFQGELWGESIQGNREGIKGHRFSVFSVFDIKAFKYLPPAERREMCEKLGIEHVPVLGTNWNAPLSIKDALEMAEGPSVNHAVREGLVWKCNEDPDFSFKTISNLFLLKEK